MAAIPVSHPDWRRSALDGSAPLLGAAFARGRKGVEVEDGSLSQPARTEAALQQERIARQIETRRA